MKYKHLTLMLLLCFGASAKAQQTDTVAAFSLKQAIEYAQNHQASVLNARIDEDIAANTVRQTIGIGLPQVSGNANFQDFIKVPTTFLPDFITPATYGVLNKEGVKDANGNTIQVPAGDPALFPVQFGVKYQSSVGLELSQLLFDGSYLVGLQASRTFKELASKNLTRTRIETSVAVTKAYYSVLVSNEQLNLLDANLDRLRKSLSDTEAMFKNGFVEKIDVDRLTVLKNNLETERENVIRLLALNVNLLKFQMGMTINSSLTLTDSITILQGEPTVIIPDSSAYRNRIEYSLLETQKKLNEFDLKRYKSQFLPSLAAFGSASQSFQANRFADLYNTNFPSTIIGLRLSVPIISGGIKLYQVRNAKLAILKTQNDLVNLQNGINLEVDQAQTTYLNSLRSLDNQKRNMDLAEEVLRVTKIKYEQGVGSSIEVTSAETSLKESQNNYINALYDQMINRVNVDKALGRINY